MIKRLEVSNFICFKGRQVVDFADHDGVILITGSYDEDPAMSNQAGKTTILHAILYVLYGWSKSLCEREVDLIYEENGEVAESMEVLITIDIGGEEINIRRGRTRDNKPIFAVAGFGGQMAEQQEALEAKLGMPLQDFLATTFFQQGDIHVFMNAKPAEKKEYLKRWLDFSRWNDYADRMKEHVATHGAHLQKLQHEIEAVERTILEVVDEDQERQLLEEKENRRRQFELGQQVELQAQRDADALPDAAVQEQAVVEARRALAAPQQQLDASNRAIKDIEQRIIQAQQYAQELASLEGVDATMAQIRQQMVDLEGELKGVQDSIATADAQCTQYEPQIKEVDGQILVVHGQERVAEQQRNDKAELAEKVKHFGSHCPFDRQPCDRVGPEFVGELEAARQQYQAAVDAARQSCTSLAAQQKAIVDARAQLQAQVGSLRQVVQQRMTWGKELQKQADQCTAGLQRRSFLKAQPTPVQLEVAKAEAVANASGWVQQIKDAQGKILAAEQEFAKLAGIQEERARLARKIADAQALRAGAAGRISEIDRALGEFDSLRKRQSTAAQEKAVKEVALAEVRETLTRWQFLEQMCRREIPSILTENAFEEVEDETNFVLKGLRSNMAIQFQATKELQAKEDVCSVCASPFPARAKTCQVCGYGERHKKRRDELVLDVHQGLSTRSFRLVSGGGKALISIALRIALTKLLQRRRGSQIDWLHLDEVFSTLDPVNRAAVVRMIFDILLTVLGFRQIFVISHTDVSDSGAHVLRVQRHEDHSTVGWA